MILVSSMLAFFPKIEAYATHPAPTIDGTIAALGCERIGGTIFVTAVDAKHTQTIELCEYGTKYFKIVNYGFCVPTMPTAKDPDTGRAYGFPTRCDIPQPCDSPTSWGNTIPGKGYYERLNIMIDEKQFNVLIQSVGGLCIVPEFIPDEKKIHMSVNGLKDTKRSIAVVIPNELLSGEFQILLDGVSSDFNITDTDNYGVKRASSSIITMELDFPKPEREVEIVGTKAIPEFPILGLIIFATALSCMLAIRMMAKVGQMN